MIWLKNLSDHDVRRKLRFRQIWADFSRTLSDDRQLFAALCAGYSLLATHYWLLRLAQYSICC